MTFDVIEKQFILIFLSFIANYSSIHFQNHREIIYNYNLVERLQKSWRYQLIDSIVDTITQAQPARTIRFTSSLVFRNSFTNQWNQLIDHWQDGRYKRSKLARGVFKTRKKKKKNSKNEGGKGEKKELPYMHVEPSPKRVMKRVARSNGWEQTGDRSFREHGPPIRS